MFMKSVLFGLIAATTLLTVSAPASAAELNLVRNEKATEQAIAALLLSDLYKRSGIATEVQPLPAARANAMTLTGEKDGEVGRIQGYATKFPTLIKVEPAYYFITTTGFAKADKGISISTQADLKKYKVGIIRGVAHTTAATEGLSGVQVVADADQLYQMLDAGRIDIALDAGVNGSYMVKKLGLKGINAVGDIARLDLFAILNPAKKDMAPKLSATISALKASGELDKLIKAKEAEFIKSGASN